MARILMFWLLGILSLAAIANPLIAIYMVCEGQWAGAAMFSFFSVAAIAVGRNAYKDRPWRSR
ncbi:MAG: hypothetical protein E5Y09_04765 [Mesorhizobium sp.]|nr:MAG: hypothetical protein E5Y09_04765 [Mesorhizobium sp.]